jgi:type VII secretion-associated protein (TIGR03931 family)
VRAHVIEVGPNTIRRLCCGVATVADSELERTALESIDDAVALVDLRPITVGSLWRSVLESVNCVGAESIVVIHPSWWAPSRVDVVSAAARCLGDEVVMKPRSWLLHQGSQRSALVVEIADGFVVVIGQAVAVETRRREQQSVVEAIAHSVLRMATNATETVFIDAPRTVHGASELSALIAGKLRDSSGVTVMQVSDIELRKVAAGLVPSEYQDYGVVKTRGGCRRSKLVLVARILSGVVGVAALLYHPARAGRDTMSTTYLVEGHVALEVPARWPVRRIVAGPGSARLQVSSPADPEVALHVTQSQVALTGLAATAEFLKGAIDAAPAGVFVDFNPAGRSAGRAVVTYREVRAGHDVRWTVWVDKAVRISIGCQSRRGDAEAVSHECDLAVRSARALR